jgi:hypothetical protein
MPMREAAVSSAVASELLVAIQSPNKSIQRRIAEAGVSLYGFVKRLLGLGAVGDRSGQELVDQRKQVDSRGGLADLIALPAYDGLRALHALHCGIKCLFVGLGLLCGSEPADQLSVELRSVRARSVAGEL